jgi:Putative beta barrel porin-7 (BBP7)
MARTRIPAIALLAMLASATMGAEPKASDKPVPSTASPEPGQAPVDPVSTPPEAGPVPSAHNGYWIRADYLGWWLTGSQLPPLVTASPPGTPRAQAGVLGAPGTQVLFGDEMVNDDFRSGVRITLGGWLDDCCKTGFELRGLVLDRRSDPFAAGSPDGSAIVSRPFLDARTGRQNAELVSFPGVLAGTVFVADAESDKFWAVDLLCRKNWCRNCSGYVDVLAGYRYLSVWRPRPRDGTVAASGRARVANQSGGRVQRLESIQRRRPGRRGGVLVRHGDDRRSGRHRRRRNVERGCD